MDFGGVVTSSCVLSVCYVDNGSLRAVGFQSLVVHFLGTPDKSSSCMSSGGM